MLSSFISERERIVTIEDAAELQLHQEHVVRLETRPPNVEGKGAIRQRQLVVNALRMRPDRIVVGEVRGEEALDMLQAMNTGHDGSLTTVHANTPRDALTRIETMIAMGATNLPERAMRQQIASAIQLVVQQTRLSDGTRKVTSISEITGMEGDIITMQEIFVFEKMGVTQEGKVIGRFRATGVRPKCCERLQGVGHPPAGRHVRRRHGGAVMLLALLVFLARDRARSSAATARCTRLPGLLASAAAGSPAARSVGARRRRDDAGRDASSTQRPKGRCRRSIALVAAPRAGSWLATLIEQSGVRTTPSAIVMISAGRCGVGARLDRRCSSRQPLAAAVAAVARRCRCRSSGSSTSATPRMKKFEEQFPEALDLLSRAIRAGHAFQTAMGMVADELPAPVGLEFKKTFEQQNFGLPLRDALERAGRARAASSTCGSSSPPCRFSARPAATSPRFSTTWPTSCASASRSCARCACTPRTAGSPATSCWRCRRRSASRCRSSAPST